MLSTPLHDKPIVYGSALANWPFFALVVVHIAGAVIAPISAIVALAARKGFRWHVRAGKYFVRSMATLAITGIVIDVVRLCFYYRENHSKYVGDSMPSTIPARLSFLFAALVVLWVLWEVTPPRLFRREPPTQLQVRIMPLTLLGIGALLALVIVTRLNPWNGSLWMIGSFCALVLVEWRARLRGSERSLAVARHRVGMTFLAAFSWWGALQGFGPAIGIAIKGPDITTTAYVGDRPGPFAPYFLLFLVAWAPLLGLAGLLVRRYRLRAEAKSQARALAAP
ncbi:MAG TPA: hypothetical protein VHB79_33165 [Polyangiaceae bacterium]|nr:hypothetical protein [Polyangiaceae bacterium]